MHKCIVCENSSQKTQKHLVTYHSIPKHPYRRMKWFHSLGLKSCVEWHRVCSDHFNETDFKPGGKRLLRPTAIPKPNYSSSNPRREVPTIIEVTRTNSQGSSSTFSLGNEEIASYTTVNAHTYISVSDNLPRSIYEHSKTSQPRRPTAPNNENETHTTASSESNQNNLSSTVPNNENEIHTTASSESNQNNLSSTASNNENEIHTATSSESNQNNISSTASNNENEIHTATSSESNQNNISETTPSNENEIHAAAYSESHQNDLSETALSNENAIHTAEYSEFHQNEFGETATNKENEIQTATYSKSYQNIFSELPHDVSENEDNKTLDSNTGEPERVSKNVGRPRRSSRKIKVAKSNEDFINHDKRFRKNRRMKKNDDNDVHSPLLDLVIRNRRASNMGIGNTLRCSVINCNNRNTSDISFFGYPHTVELRKIWIENCGLVDLVDANDRPKSNLKVCAHHFEDHMFINPDKRNRLKPNSFPTLFYNGESSFQPNSDDEMIPGPSIIEYDEVSNMISTKEVEAQEIDLDDVGLEEVDVKESTSSPTKSVHMDVKEKTNLLLGPKNSNLILIHRNDQSYSCSVPGCTYSICPRGSSMLISLFRPPKEYIEKWSSILDVELTSDSYVCEDHFTQKDITIADMEITKNGDMRKIKTINDTALPVPTGNTNRHVVPKRPMEDDNENLIVKKPKNDESEMLIDCTDLTEDCIEDEEIKFSAIIPMISKVPSILNDSESVYEEILPKILANNSLSIVPTSSKQIQPIAAINPSQKSNSTDLVGQTTKNVTEKPSLIPRSFNEMLTSEYSNSSISITKTNPNQSKRVSKNNSTKVIDCKKPLRSNMVETGYLKSRRVPKTISPNSEDDDIKIISSDDDCDSCTSGSSYEERLQKSLAECNKNAREIAKAHGRTEIHDFKQNEKLNVLINPDKVVNSDKVINCEKLINSDKIVHSNRIINSNRVVNSSNRVINNIRVGNSKKVINTDKDKIINSNRVINPKRIINSNKINSDKIISPQTVISSDKAINSTPVSIQNVTIKPEPVDTLPITSNEDLASEYTKKNSEEPLANNSMSTALECSSTQDKQISSINSTEKLSQSLNIKVEPGTLPTTVDCLPSTSESSFPHNEQVSKTTSNVLKPLTFNHITGPKMTDKHVMLTTTMPNTPKSAEINSAVTEKKALSNLNRNDNTLIRENVVYNNIHDLYNNMMRVSLPSGSWYTVMDSTNDLKVFAERNLENVTIKMIVFGSTLTPVVKVNGKYFQELMNPIECQFDLEKLLSRIDNVRLCMGFDEYIDTQCIGYFESDTLSGSCKSCTAFADNSARHWTQMVALKLTVTEEIKMKTISVNKTADTNRKILLQKQKQAKVLKFLKAVNPSKVMSVLHSGY